MYVRHGIVQRIAGLALFVCHPALAGFKAPPDFAGYSWQTHITEFAGLELVGADVMESVKGRNMLVEYRAPAHYGAFPDTSFRSVSFLFCDLHGGLRFCGVVARLDDHAGNFDRIKASLIERHGEPAIESPRYEISVATPEGAVPTARHPRYERYVWGRKGRNDVVPVYDVAITMTFEPDSGRGEIIYATQELYRLAYHVYAHGDPNYYLYRQLEGGLHRKYAERNICTGSLSCKPTRRPLSEEELASLRTAGERSLLRTGGAPHEGTTPTKAGATRSPPQ